MNYETLFANPTGRTARGPFIAALATLLAVFAFYWLWVPGRTGQFAMLVMIYPGMVLHARRLHDMGKSGWLVLLPGALLLATGLFHLYSPEATAARYVTQAALGLAVGFMLTGIVFKGQAEPAAA
jgi:uncharacterized membrane protein YhaH (DUF805 family)